MPDQVISDECLALAEAVAKDAARSGMLSFACYVRDKYKVNWHNKLLCDYLDRFERGECRRLIITMPPRHGKSELASRLLPAYILGRRPNAQIISTSCGSDLAQAMNRDVQRVICDQRYAELFPSTKLNDANVRTVTNHYLRNSDIFEVVGKRGYYLCAGVDGNIIGRGGNYILIDDPVKNRQEAYSATFRNKLWDWYTSVALPRLCGDPRCVLLIMTRWHEDDFAGRLIAKAEEEGADQWEVLRLEAIKEGPPTQEDPREEGEPLWPSEFSLNDLGSIKASTSASVWASQYQCRPTLEGGNIIKEEWIKHYNELPEEINEWWQSWDLTFDKTASGSYVVGQVWCRKGANCYLVHQIRKRLSFTESIVAITKMSAEYPRAIRKKIEKKANGAAVLDTLKGKVPGLVAVEPKGSKEDRLRAVSVFFEAGNVFVPRPSKCAWVGDFIEELTHFPSTAHDDQVDATSQSLIDIGHHIKYTGYKASGDGIRAGLLRKKGGIL